MLISSRHHPATGRPVDTSAHLPPVNLRLRLYGGPQDARPEQHVGWPGRYGVRSGPVSCTGCFWLDAQIASAARAIPARLDLAIGGALVHPVGCLHFLAGLQRLVNLEEVA